jgi:hypothetical protein
MHTLVLALMLTLTSPSWAGIGVVSDAKGSACSIERAKQKLSGSKGANVESMDTFVTGSCSASITFKDDTKVKVTENSKLLIDDFVYDAKKSDSGKLVLRAAMGTVRYTSGQIAKNNPQSVDVKTPTATVAVRGTDFTMTIDETGQSLIVLVPSCKDESEQKKYELDEQRCKVGQIDVYTLAGKVTLEHAFEATFVQSASMTPTPPVIMNTIEGKIGNNLIIVKPPEVVAAIREQGKSKQDKELEELEAEASRRLSQMVRESSEVKEAAKVLPYTYDSGKQGCDPSKSICVRWEKPDATEIQSKGRGTAFRNTEGDHYAEVKTAGYESNTFITITHNDNISTAWIGSGDPGGNIVYIKQNSGILKQR